MVRKKRFYTQELRDQVVSAYNNSDESAAEIALRFDVNHQTVKTWVYRKRSMALLYPPESVKFALSATDQMSKNSALSPATMESRIRELEQQLAVEKMRSESLIKMIDIAERELKVDIRKKSGAKQSKK